MKEVCLIFRKILKNMSEIIAKRSEVKFYKSWKENCPFCNISAEKILWKWKYFFIMRNDNPYIKWWKHLLLNPIRHILFTKDYTKEEIVELIEAEKFIFNFYWSEDYFSFIRQSLSTLSRTVEHLHYHYLSWAVSPDDIQKAILFNKELWKL